MPSVFEKIALKVLSHYLDNYINVIQSSQLKLALATGNAELNNVSVKPTALSVHHLPFTVTSGVIQSIKLHFPWKSLKKQSCIIEIDGIHIIANFSKDVKLKSELEIKESVLKEFEEAGLTDEKVKNALFQGTLSQIISNIIIHIKNIHIRVEIGTPDPSTTFAVGIMCKQIDCFSISENGEQTFVQQDGNIAKRINIQDFSIYADTDPGSLSALEKDQEKHEYILDSFSFSSDYVMAKNQLQTHANMSNQIDQIYFKLTQKQMSVFGEYLFQYNLFQLRQKYSIYGRPHHQPIDENEAEERKIALMWWQFAHKCTIEKRYPNRININESLLILKTRNNYYKIWKIRQSMNIQDFKKSSNYTKLKKFEEKLPLNAILFLRNYSNYRINKENEDKSKLVLDKNDLEMLTSSNTIESSSNISLLINKIKIKIYESLNDKKPILTFAAHELSSKLIQSFDKSTIFSLICRSMKVYSQNKIIFQQDSARRSSFELTYNSMPDKKEEKVDIYASSPFINVDLKFLYNLKVMLYDNGFAKCPSSNYFSFTRQFADMMTEESNKCSPYMIRKGQYADVILQKKCDEYPFMKIKIKLFSPTVKIEGVRLSFQMKEIDFESFPIHERFVDQVETLYINYLLRCIDFTIGLGENEILKPITIDFYFWSIIAPCEWLDKFRVALNTSSIAVIFNKESYGEIVSGIDQLLKLTQDFEQMDSDKTTVQKTEQTNYIDNLNMESLSTNYATKVSIYFKNISLELDTIGRFDVVNFETQITIGSNGLDLNLRIKNIICNSLENKYIFFDINETDSENHFLKENNAVVCQYLLFFDKAMKIDMSVNSPTVIIDFGWLETTLNFFKSADIKSIIGQPEQTPEQPIVSETDNNIMETIMTNSMEFQLLKPTFKVILPAINKCKDDIELTLNLDYITFGEVEDQSDGKKGILMKMPTFSFEWKKRLIATISNFSVLIGEKTSLFFDELTVLDIVEDNNIIDIKSLKQNQDNQLTNPILVLQYEKNKISTTINDFNLIFDVNSSMIPELILSLLKSSIIADIVSSFIDDTNNNEKPKEENVELTTYIIVMPKANIVLIDKDVKLHTHFSGTFTFGPDVNHMFVSGFNLSFSEKDVNFAPILKNIILEFGIRGSDFIFSLLDKTIAFISPSDIIDTMNFVNKVMNLYFNFSHQLDYSNFFENNTAKNESTPIKNISVAYNQITFVFCEDNRTAQIPFPFVRLQINPKSTKVSLTNEPSFLLLGFHVDIFNKNTQRWDLLVEPLEIYLSFTDMKHYYIQIKDKLNVIISHAILNQICQFQFERQTIDYKNVLPSFFVENNTPEMCELVFKNQEDNILIPPRCLSTLKKNQPFKFMGNIINPMNFYSPQFISNKYSVSIFTKGKERYISINSPVLFKNKSNIDLFYHEKHTGNVVDIYHKSITPICKLAAEFGIYGKDPIQTPQGINLFTLKEKQKLYIPVQVEDKTYYFYLSIKFSNKRGIVILTLTPRYIIRNNYKLPITLTVNEAQQKVVIPGKSTEYLNHVGFDSSFTFSIEAHNHVSQSTQLILKNNTFVPLFFTSNSAFSLRFDNDIITLQPPLLVQNLTNLPVSIFDYQNNLIFTLQTKSSEDFIGPIDFFKDNKIQLAIQVAGYEKSEHFETTIGRKEMFLKSFLGNLFIPIALICSIGTTGIIHLKIDHLIYVRNESIQKLIFQPVVNESNAHEESSLVIDPGQTKPVLFGTPELNFMFNAEPYKHSIQINFQNTLENRNNFSTLFIKQAASQRNHQIILSVDFQTSSTLAGYYVVFKNCMFPQPLVLTNLLGEKNIIEQTDIVVSCGFKSQIIVRPLSTSIVSSRDLVGQKLRVSCYSQNFEVDLIKFTEPTKETIQFGDVKIDIYLKLVCLENGSHLIIISNEIENKPNKFNLFSTHEISFNLSIPFISLSLIDDRMRELALVGFTSTSIECEFTKDTVEMNLQIDMFQIDDMYPDTIVPVAVFNSTPPFISLRIIKENANMIFDLIELKLKPLTFYIDINYIAELFNFFTTIQMKKNEEPNESKESSIPILIKQIYIDKVSINASASSQTGRPIFHPFPYEFILDYIPTVSNAHLSRKEFTKTDLSSDNKVLNEILKDYYDPLLREIKGLVAARSVAFVFKGISNAFHKMGDSSKIDVSFNQEKGKVIQRSFQSFGKGILNGVTGVIMKPVKGAQKDGAKGFFVGLGKGFGGIITDPVAGLIDAGAGIIDEVKNSLSESRDSMRYSRVFNNTQIQEYDEISAICQLQYQRHIKDYNDTFVYFINGNDIFVGITQSSIAFLVHKNQKKNPSKKYVVSQLRQIADIENVNANDKVLSIQFKDHTEIKITCQSSEIANIATKIIVSRSYYSNYHSNSANMTKMASSSSLPASVNEEKENCIIKNGCYNIKTTNGKFLSNDLKAKTKGCEKFQITNNDDGTISFLSMKNSKYVKVGTNSKLAANSSKIALNEKFSVTKVDDNHYCFLSMKTKQYVSVDKLDSLHANKSDIKGSEKFELIKQD